MSAFFAKYGLIAAWVCIGIAGIIMIIVGATGTSRGLIAYGVAALGIAALGAIYATAGRPDVSVNPPNKVGGILTVPWWVWLIDVGLIALAAVLANTLLA